MTILRMLNAVLVAGAVSTVLAFAVDFSAMWLELSRAGDYVVELYVFSMLILVPLCFVRFNRSDECARLTLLEREIAINVARRLPSYERDVWEQQVQAIARVERAPSGSEIKFLLRDTGRNPYLPLPLFTNQESFAIATMKLNFTQKGKVVEVEVWCDKGRISAIFYYGDVDSLAPVADLTSVADVRVSDILLKA